MALWENSIKARFSSQKLVVGLISLLSIKSESICKRTWCSKQPNFRKESELCPFSQTEDRFPCTFSPLCALRKDSREHQSHILHLCASGDCGGSSLSISGLSNAAVACSGFRARMCRKYATT